MAVNAYRIFSPSLQIHTTIHCIIPDILINHFFALLDPRELNHCSRTCHSWFNLTQMFKKQFFAEKFGFGMTKTLEGFLSSKKIRWSSAPFFIDPIQILDHFAEHIHRERSLRHNPPLEISLTKSLTQSGIWQFSVVLPNSIRVKNLSTKNSYMFTEKTNSKITHLVSNKDSIFALFMDGRIVEYNYITHQRIQEIKTHYFLGHCGIARQFEENSIAGYQGFAVNRTTLFVLHNTPSDDFCVEQISRSGLFHKIHLGFDSGAAISFLNEDRVYLQLPSFQFLSFNSETGALNRVKKIYKSELTDLKCHAYSLAYEHQSPVWVKPEASSKEKIEKIERFGNFFILLLSKSQDSKIKYDLQIRDMSHGKVLYKIVDIAKKGQLKPDLLHLCLTFFHVLRNLEIHQKT